MIAPTRKGFTVIELSIVLVVIGVALGGIFVGRSLIHASQIRKTIAQKEKFDQALAAFVLQYSCMPGDCADAYEKGIGTSPATAATYGTNGNGSLAVETADPDPPYESVNFWYHLAQARLIDWTPPTDLTDTPNNLIHACGQISPCLGFETSSPENYMGGWWIVFGQDPAFSLTVPPSRAHYWWITGAVMNNEGPGQDQYGSSVLLPSAAYDIDVKVDDGLPYSGIAIAAGGKTADVYGPTDPNADAGGPGTLACVDNSTSPETYNVLATERQSKTMCSLLIKTSAGDLF